MFCYIHIPFCQSRCKYCRFSTFSSKDDLDKQVYVDFLVNQISSANEKQELLSSIYFGGGTPTSLNNSQIEKIIKSLNNKFGFKDDIEITLETTISNISEENLLVWENLGINRLSLGIQTLNNDSLKEIGRPSREEILEKLKIINDYFITPPTHDVRFSTHLRGTKGELNLAISLDFIIGLPFVKKGEIKKDIQFILKNYQFVNHISLYMLEEYYDYPKKWQELSISEDKYLEEYKNCKKYLEENGFSRYELSNFAKQGFECNHNKAYWNHSDIISFGLGSHGYLNGTRYVYPNNFKDYYAGIIDYKEDLKEKDLFLENVMFGLRTTGLEKKVYQKLNKEKIKYFIEQKLLDFQDDKLILKDDGVTIIDYIIKEII